MTALAVTAAAGVMSIQDSGRAGFQRYGVAESGAIDRYALAEGHALLGNASDCAVIEMAASGGRFSTTGEPLWLATSGAAMKLAIDNRPLPWRSSFLLGPGQQLEIGSATDGVYGYLHVTGGFAVTPILQSRSTHSRAGFGGWRGRLLQTGDQLPVGQQPQLAKRQKLSSPDYFQRHEIRVVWGTQAHLFTDTLRQRFLDTEFSISLAHDRMGVRLESDQGGFLPESGLSGISDAVIAGDVQVAGDGVPAVLLADRQPTGGYPRIATVISADQDALAQMPAGHRFRFQLVDLDSALAALRRYRASLQILPAQLQPVLRDPAEVSNLLEYSLISGVIDGHDPS